MSVIATAPHPSRRRFGDLSTGVKILTAVGLASLVALTVGLVGLMALSKASSAARRIYSRNLARRRHHREVRQGLHRRHGRVPRRGGAVPGGTGR